MGHRRWQCCEQRTRQSRTHRTFSLTSSSPQSQCVSVCAFRIETREKLLPTSRSQDSQSVPNITKCASPVRSIQCFLVYPPISEQQPKNSSTQSLFPIGASYLKLPNSVHPWVGQHLRILSSDSLLRRTVYKRRETHKECCVHRKLYFFTNEKQIALDREKTKPKKKYPHTLNTEPKVLEHGCIGTKTKAEHAYMRTIEPRTSEWKICWSKRQDKTRQPRRRLLISNCVTRPHQKKKTYSVRAEYCKHRVLSSDSWIQVGRTVLRRIVSCLSRARRVWVWVLMHRSVHKSQNKFECKAKSHSTPIRYLHQNRQILPEAIISVAYGRSD